ncbi:MAG: cyclic nucleotide-binding domain-containing protein [Coriobacteriia bacterium]|nr:cyclic nucleotide-binding domain-containing protein [Coriobacteriia bacterium]
MNRPDRGMYCVAGAYRSAAGIGGSAMGGDVLVRKASNGAIIFSEGDPPDGMYVILGGKVKIFRQANGHETTLALLKQGDFFGEMSLFDHKPRSAGAISVGETELRFISNSEFQAMPVSDPFVRQMLLKMSERLREVDDALAKLDAENDARHTYLSNLSVHREWAV